MRLILTYFYVFQLIFETNCQSQLPQIVYPVKKSSVSGPITEPVESTKPNGTKSFQDRYTARGYNAKSSLTAQIESEDTGPGSEVSKEDENRRGAHVNVSRWDKTSLSTGLQDRMREEMRRRAEARQIESERTAHDDNDLLRGFANKIDAERLLSQTASSRVPLVTSAEASHKKFPIVGGKRFLVVDIGERIDGDFNSETIFSRKLTEFENVRSPTDSSGVYSNSGRLLVDESNSAELRRTTTRELLKRLEDGGGSGEAHYVTGTLPAGAAAVALKTPEFVRPKNAELESRKVHLVSHDTSPIQDTVAAIPALHSSKTLTDGSLPLERPAPASFRSSSISDRNRIRQIPSYPPSHNTDILSNTLSTQLAYPTPLGTLFPLASSLSFTIPPAFTPPESNLGPNFAGSRPKGQPDQIILPLLLTPPIVFPENNEATVFAAPTTIGITTPATTLAASNIRYGSANKAVKKAKAENAKHHYHKIQIEAKKSIDESDFDLLMPPKPAAPSTFYHYQDPGQSQLQLQVQRTQYSTLYNQPILAPPASQTQAQFGYGNYAGGTTMQNGFGFGYDTGNNLTSIGAPNMPIGGGPSLTAYLPAQSQQVSAGADGGTIARTNAKLDSCCRKQGVSSFCQMLCNFDTFTEKSLVRAVLQGQCPGDELSRAFACATSRADHSSCCRRAGINAHAGGQCMTFCTTHKPTPLNILDYVACLRVFDRIKTCYREHQSTNPNIYGD